MAHVCSCTRPAIKSRDGEVSRAAFRAAAPAGPSASVAVVRHQARLLAAILFLALRANGRRDGGNSNLPVAVVEFGLLPLRLLMLGVLALRCGRRFHWLLSAPSLGSLQRSC